MCKFLCFIYEREDDFNLLKHLFMKSIFTLKSLILTICVILSFNVQSQNTVNTIDIKKAGTLSSLIPSMQKNTITALTLTGEINGTDIRFIREMAGSTYNGGQTVGRLAVLDLSGVKIVRGGDTYYTNLISLDNTIGRYMFRGCNVLTNVKMPNSVTIIEQGAFEGCNLLRSVIIPNQVTSIGNEAFKNCIQISEITIPNSVLSIGEGAFYGCRSLAAFTIPNSVVNIGEMAFQGCRNLKQFVVSDDHTAFSVIDGIIYSKDKSILLRCPEGKARINTFSDNLTHIGNEAFFGCYNLQSVTIPYGVTYLGGQSFENCIGLTYIKIPNSVTSIGCAFYGCKNLNEVHNSSATPQSIDMFCFEFVDKKTCKIYVPTGSLEKYRNAPFWQDFDIILEENVTTNDYINNKNISISNITNGICIKSNKLIHIVVFSISGQKVFDSELQGEVNISLSKGIYIVKAGDENLKTVVR